jgi:hypothetical protein
MYTAIRLRHRPENDTIIISIPELRKLKGRDLEIIIMVEGELEDTTVPPKAIQNSSHTPGSTHLDEEAIREFLKSRFR